MRVAEVADPQTGPGDVLIAVEAAGVSRADALQRFGKYPPPPGVTDRLGLEVAGTITQVGPEVTRWKVGDRVCALLSGGGYAELAVAPAGQVLPIPDGWTAIEAASLPENAFTVYDNVFTRGGLTAGQTLLVHGGTSGIGTTAIMFAVALGATVFATAGSAAKCEACIRIGATAAIDYKQSDFVAEVARLTDDAGVDVVFDLVGGDYIPRDIACLALDGRVVCIATMRGVTAQIDLGKMMSRRASLLTSSLRPRTIDQKAAIASALLARIWPLLAARDRIHPQIDSVYTFEQAPQAHRRLESSEHVGKIVLTP
jgi:putative PIG3 family NAD(P)H quinone oxidoreductase